MITEKHRIIYCNNELQFALFYDPTITDLGKIKEDFLSSKDWKDYLRHFNVKSIKSFNISKDLKNIHIEVKFN